MNCHEAHQRPGTTCDPDHGMGTVEVDDSTHIIDRYTNLFDSHQMTLAELASKTQPAGPQSPPRLALSMTAPGPAGGKVLLIEQRFHQLCTELHAQGSIRVINHPQHQEIDGVLQ